MPEPDFPDGLEALVADLYAEVLGGAGWLDLAGDLGWLDLADGAGPIDLADRLDLAAVEPVKAADAGAAVKDRQGIKADERL